MKASPILLDEVSREPIGIVISRGKHEQPAPRVWAYVYGPAPETPESGKDG
jgi:hypothetical protein